MIQSLLPCEITGFPCKYLGLPLSLKKLIKDQLQHLIDKIADQFPGWKADLMIRAGRVVQVQFVLTAMLIYPAMAIDFPSWAIKVVDKIRRGFVWKGHTEAKGGQCLVTWPKACRAKELGISDLKSLGIALRVRWPRLKKYDPNKLWANLPLQVSKEVESLLSLTITIEIGDGANTLFWKDRWLADKNI